MRLVKIGAIWVCCAFSPACLFLKEYLDKAVFGEQLKGDFKAIFGDSLEPNADDEILELAKKANNNPAKPKIYTACGSDDHLQKLMSGLAMQ